MPSITAGVLTGAIFMALTPKWDSMSLVYKLVVSGSLSAVLGLVVYVYEV